MGSAVRAPGLAVNDGDNLDPDDLSAIVAYGGRIGVMWSNQNAQAMYFASHVDGAPDSAWTQTAALDGPFSADDHINLKSVQGDGGRVFAAVKTSKSDPSPTDFAADQVDLLEFASGTWSRHVFGSVADDQTRPIVVTDQIARRLYLFATTPTNPSPGVQTIVYKETSLDNPSFAPGPGTVFMRSDSGADINDASSTKQDVSVAPELVVLASDFTHYWHNALALSHPTPTPTPVVTATATPSAVPTATATPSAVPTASAAPSPTVAPTPAGDRTAPVLSRLSARPQRFRTRRRAGRPAGTTLRFRLSEPATVRLRLERAVTGRRVGGGCVRRTRDNRSKRSCVRFVIVRGSLSRRLSAGSKRLAFSGRLGNRRAAPGRYRVALLAIDAAANASAIRRVGVRILR